jgi:hypothetical protein
MMKRDLPPQANPAAAAGMSRRPQMPPQAGGMPPQMPPQAMGKPDMPTFKKGGMVRGNGIAKRGKACKMV